MQEGQVQSMIENLIDSGLFICGHPKSGTSLLMTMLDSHPELIVYPEETHYFRKLLALTSSVSRAEIPDLVDQHLFHVFRWNLETPPESQEGFFDRDYSSFDDKEVSAAFRRIIASTGTSKTTVLAAAILAYGEVSKQLTEKTRYWVEKTPYNEFYASRIFRLWPKARCIHIVRDPRDNYASYQRKHPEWTASQFGRSWLKSLHHGWKNQRRYGETQYFLLRYEDLVGSTDQWIQAIVDFLDIQDDQVLRKPSRAGTAWRGNSMFGDEFSSISSRPSGRYKDALSEDVIANLSGLLLPEIRQLGYPSEQGLTPFSAARARLQRLKWELSGRFSGQIS
jgi:hypothetical protein